jgi:hypothetical protein
LVLDTKKGLLKADKEKEQYVDSEKRNSKENRKKKFCVFFYIALTPEHRMFLWSSANNGQRSKFYFYFFLLFFVLNQIGPTKVGPAWRLGQRSRAGASGRARGWGERMRSRLGDRRRC